MDTWFDLKAIEFFGRQCVILCQNENGPCPLLAIANVLILQNSIFVHPDKRCIALNELIEIVANAFVEKDASRSHESDVRKDSRQHQLNSVLNIIPNMARGLDLNVLFSGVNAFEFTEEISVFDALDIPLLHGWVLDPQDMVTSSVIKTNDSYNHLMFKLVEYRSIQERVTSCSRKFESESKSDSAANSAPKEKSNVDLIEFSSSPDPIVSSGLQTSESWEAVSATENTDSSPYVIIPTGQGTIVTNPSTQSKNVPALKDGELSTAAALTSVVDKSHAGSEGIASSQTAVLAADSFFPPAPPAVENRKDLSPEDIELCKEGEVIEAFLASTAAQLTYIGLAALHQILQERQLAVFFRNNHFSTIFRNNGKLYLLVTDMGYQNVESVVWERLDDIDGDTEYMDGHFIRTPRDTQALSYHDQDVSSPHYVYQGTIALPPQDQQQPLQQQQQQQQQQRAHTEPLAMQRSEVDRDLLLAIQLQDEENERANQRTRSSNPLSNSFWSGNSDTPTSHSKAQILQHRALTQASQSKAQRRPSAQGGGSGQGNRRAGTSPPEEESNSPCLIC